MENGPSFLESAPQAAPPLDRRTPPGGYCGRLRVCAIGRSVQPSTDSYRIDIRRRSPGQFDVLVYIDSDGRSIEFDCKAAADPVAVWIPGGKSWVQRAPPWARERRDTIVARILASGAIVYETEHDQYGNSSTSILAPDRSFRVECSVQIDDRAPAWERTRITASNGEILADLPLHATSGLVEFPQPGCVVLDLRGRYGDAQRLLVDVAQRTYRLDGDSASAGQPLNLLASRLAPPRPSARTALPSAPRRKFFELMIGLVSVPFAAGGLWLSLTGKTGSDRLAGVVGIVIGGFGIASAVAELRRARAARAAAAAKTAAD